MDVREALYTTRAMRRVRPDPIPLEVEQRILDAAVRAPSGGNSQGWRFVMVDRVDVKAALGPLYRDSVEQLWSGAYAERLKDAAENPNADSSVGLTRLVRSVQHLADHFEDVPLFMFAFVRRDESGRSILPAVWSSQLAARADGVGSALTSALGNAHHDEVCRILEVPDGEGWLLVCCVSFGYPTGRWAVAQRVPIHEVAYRNHWDEPLGYEVTEPLWP